MPTPSAEPRDYRICAYLQTLLRTLTASTTYWNTLAGDQVKIAVRALPPVLPGVAIRPPVFATDYDAPLPDYGRKVTVKLEIYAQTTGEDEGTTILAVCRLRQDVIKALESDRGLGQGTDALVYDLRIQSGEGEWIQAETGAIGCILTVETDFSVAPGSV